MQLDASRIRQAALELGAAVQHADAAAAVEVPRVFGRGAAKATIATELDEAIRRANAAGDVLATLDGPVADAKLATDLLANESSLAIDSFHRLRGTEFQPALEGARTLHAELLRIGTALDAPTGDLADSLATLFHDPSAKVHDWRAINTVAARRMDELGPAGPYLAEVTNDSHRLAMAADVLSGHPDGLARAWGNLTRTAYDAPVRVDSLRRAFTDIAATVTGDVPPQMPAWLANADAGSWIRPTADQARELRLLARSGSREDVTAQVLEVLSSPNLERPDLELLKVAGRLGDDLAVDVPLAPRDPTLQQMLDVETQGLYIRHKELLHDAYVRLATSADGVLDREAARLSRSAATAHDVRLLGRLGVERPQAVLGAAGSEPWATTLLGRALDPQLRTGQARAIADAFEVVRRTGGDRGRLLDEFARLAAATPGDDDPQLRMLGHALRVLPDELRPRGASAVQSHLDMVFSGERSRPGHWAHAHGRLVDAVGVMVEGERLALDPATTRAAITAEVDDLVAGSLDDIDDATLRRLAVISTLPAELRPNLQPHDGTPFAPLAMRTSEATPYPRELVDWIRVLREGEQFAAQPGTTRATTTAELRRVLEIPPDVRTHGDVRRMLMLRNLPDEVSPIVGREPDLSTNGLERVADIGGWNQSPDTWAGMSEVARREVEQLRLSVERSEAVLAGATPQTVQAELRTLLDTPAMELGPDQLRRIAVLEGLPRDVLGFEAVSIPQGSVSSLWTPGQAGPGARTNLGMLRLSVDAAQDAAAHSYTQQDLTRELGVLLSRDNDQLTPEQQRRVALIASMPPELRPDLPDGFVSRHSVGLKTLPEVHVEDLWRAGHGRNATDAAREAILPNGGLSLDDLVAMVRQPDGSVRLGGLAPSARKVVSHASVDELRRVGISPTSLARDVLEATRGSGDRRAVTQAIRDAVPIVDRIEVASDGERQVLARLREHLQRNLERVDGRRHDGYSIHPDYAEHGRAIEDAVLLGRIEDLRRSQATAKATAAAKPAAETLTW